MDERELYDSGLTLVIERRHQRLANAEIHDRLLGIDLRILAERIRRRLDHFLLRRREGPECMLHAVTELARHRVGNVERILRDEINPDALRSNETHHLLDLLQQRFRRVFEQEMRLIKEEHELRLWWIADLG